MFVSVKTKVYVDTSGGAVEMPGLMTPVGLLTPLTDYFLSKRLSHSLPWRKKVTRSVELFLDYMHANPLETDTRQLFDNFANRLYEGTFDGKTYLDPSGLCWTPHASNDAANIITDLTLFFTWLGTESAVAAKINPIVEATHYDRIWIDAARRFRRDRALLSHLWPKKDEESGKTLAVRGRRVQAVKAAEPPAFPDERFDELIHDGFRVGNRIDHRGICITLLCHGAGFRESEPFHLFVEDVIPEPKDASKALVRVHHPSDGFAHWRDSLGRRKKDHRRAYLMERFGLVPRNLVDGTLHAGWKGGLKDGKHYYAAHWFKPDYANQFMEHWLRYLHQVARTERDHPFAFVNLGREPAGGMYKLGTYLEAHAAACRRIGLEVNKDLGTTPHGHRHSYGRRLAAAGLDKKTVQTCMHHSQESSQDAYTQSSVSEVRDALAQAHQRMAARHAPLLTETA